MGRRRRFLIRWGCLSLSVVVLAVWAVSPWRWLSLYAPFWKIEIGEGVLSASFLSMSQLALDTTADLPYERVGAGLYWEVSGDSRYGRKWWDVSSREIGLTMPTYWIDEFPSESPGRECMVSIPMWLLFSIAAALAAWMFWRDRKRFGPGHCQRCDYDLTGNVSGICPECGKRIQAT